MYAHCSRRGVSCWEGEETVVQLQEPPDESWGGRVDRYTRQAFAALCAAGFDPKRAAIAGMYAVATPLLDVVGGDSIDASEMLVIMAYRPPADDAPPQESSPSPEVVVAAGVTPATLARAPTWYHEHTRALLVTLAGGSGTVWILGGTDARTGAMPNS
jgi:hypothetical protein